MCVGLVVIVGHVGLVDLVGLASYVIWVPIGKAKK